MAEYKFGVDMQAHLNDAGVGDSTREIIPGINDWMRANVPFMNSIIPPSRTVEEQKQIESITRKSALGESAQGGFFDNINLMYFLGVAFVIALVIRTFTGKRR